MNKKIYVCHANECIFNSQGSCNHDSDIVTIGTYNGGQAICPNYTVDADKLALIERMYEVLVVLLLEDHGDTMDEDIRNYGLCTSDEYTVFMELDGGDHLQDICTDNDRVAAVVDVINILKYGRVLKVKECN